MNPDDKAHNSACARARRIVGKYIEGTGLFMSQAREECFGKELTAPERSRV